MAALQASFVAMAASHGIQAQVPCCSSSPGAATPVGVAMARVGSRGVAQGMVYVSPARWRGPLVGVRAQEKSSVQERSVEEKDRDLAASRVSFQDQKVEEPAEAGADSDEEDYDVDAADDAAFRSSAAGEEDYGEVNKILASRVEDGQTQYLIEWKDDHSESWEPADNIARFRSLAFPCMKFPLMA